MFEQTQFTHGNHGKISCLLLCLFSITVDSGVREFVKVCNHGEMSCWTLCLFTITVDAAVREFVDVCIEGGVIAGPFYLVKLVNTWCFPVLF